MNSVLKSRGNTGRLRFALLAGTVLAVGALPTMAMAAAPAQSQQHKIDIAAGPLAPALKQLAGQTGLQIMYDEETIQGRTTRGVRGDMSASQALTQLLSETGIAGRFAGGRQVVLDMTTGATEDDTAAAPAQPGEVVLQPLVIYGSRETTTLGKSAASVGVVTAKDLEDGQIRTTQESFRRLGNVMDSAFVNSGFVIRGMGTEGFSAAGAPMGSVYIDGVLQTRYGARFGARNLWDTEQVEVYRGPQSTLSGRAATAGAIYIKTKDPTFDKEVEISGTVGNREMHGGSFVVNAPIVDDQIAMRISGSYLSQKTDIEYPTYEQYSNLDDMMTDLSGSIRTKILFQPAEMPETRALLSYSYTHDRPNERLIFGNRSIYATNPLDLDEWRGDGSNLGGIQTPTLAEYRGIKVHNLGLEVTHEFSDALKLTSLSALNYGTTERLSVNASDGPDGMRGTVDDSLFTQELRLNYEQDRWSWVLGGFASYEKFDSDLSLKAADFFTDSRERYLRETTNLALFGEATYEFAPTWFLTAGGRLDYLEEETTETSSGTFLGATQISPPPGAIDEVNFVPKISLAKDIAEGHRIGVTYSEGFRTGGYYVDKTNPDPKRHTVGYYDPEHARNYELFYKGQMLDDRLTLNANLFFTQYTDQQVELTPNASIPSRTIIANAGSSRAWGFEIEPTFQVNEQLSLFTSFGYLNSRFEDFTTTTNGTLDGQSFPDAPEWNVAFGGRYDFLNGFFVGGDAKYTSSYNGRLGEGKDEDAMEKIDARVIVNMQAGYKRDNWEINAFAENLLDEKYLTFTDKDTAVPGNSFAQAGQRRSFGVNFKAKF